MNLNNMNNQNPLASIIEHATNTHAKVNHLYDGKPYSVHLKMVAETAKMFVHKYFYNEENDDIFVLLLACWLHDIIEDCRETYNDVYDSLILYGISSDLATQVTDIVFAVSNEKGKTRAERANRKYYQSITKTYGATFVKLCDRIANVKYSKNKGSRMYHKYRQEHENFIKNLPVSIIYGSMIEELNYLLELEQKKASWIVTQKHKIMFWWYTKQNKR